ncbi:hypothetical protein [Sphingomonas sp.]|uniref:hypothetical protein n=1 Tax=Sphingomonas sp. TaxID=28214 RepID=UPI003D6C7E58
MALLSCSMLVTGCSAYLHHPARAIATADLQTKFGALATPAYFAAQEKNLADFAQREDKALADLLVTSRDYRLLNIIKPASTVSNTKATPVMRLTELVGGDLEASYGTKVLTPDQAKTLMTSRFTKDLAVRTTAFNERRVATTARSYKAAGGGLAVDCPTVVASAAPGAPPINHPDASQTQRYGQLVQACQALGQRKALAKDCDPRQDGRPVIGGNLAMVCDQIAALAEDKVLAKDKTPAKEKALAERKAQLERAENALKEAMKAANPSDEGKGLQEAIDFLKSIDGLPTDERLAKVLTTIDAVFGSELEASLGTLDDKAKTVLPKATEPLINALELLEAIRALEAQAAARPLDQPSALLIGMAKIRHDLNIVAIDLDTAKQQQALLLDEAALLRAQLYYLAQAQQALCGRSAACGPVATGRAAPSAQAFDEGLSYYVRSQNAGGIPFEILRFREIQLQRAAALKRARASEADYRALIQPAIDQIAAYGAGGIKPETIANFVAGLPVAGSILVK